MQPVAVDLFAGAGGFSLGLRDAGFRIGWAVDLDSAAVRTYRQNLGTHIEERAISDVRPEQVLEALEIYPGGCDLVVGGPPCQGFSVQRLGSDDDPRNGLMLDLIRLVEHLKPKMVLMENVAGLLSKRGVSVMREFTERLDRAGYTHALHKLDAARFGVPQHRVRVFMVGQRADMFDRPFLMPTGPVSDDGYVTVWEAIGDLPPPPLDGSAHPDIANHFREARLSRLNLERLRHIPPGGGRQHLPSHLQLPCHENNPTHRHLDVYGRLAWDRPSGTITARFDSFTRGRFGHPDQLRSVTLREGARLQTFPDWFVFDGNREEVARQIGNAVPPRLACHLGKAIAAHIQGRPALDAPSSRATLARRTLGGSLK